MSTQRRVPQAKVRRVVGYARVSSQEQALGTSLTDQQNSIKAYAKGRGLKVEHIYVEAESAVREKLEHREQMRALMRDVREGDLVVCAKLDRWSRDPEFSHKSVREILEKGAHMYFVDEACDPSTDQGDSLLTFRIAFAKEEHKRIRARMVGTRQILRDQGYYADGLVPLGYRRQTEASNRVDKNVLLPVEAEVAVVRRIFRLCIAGRPIQAIADIVEQPRDRVYKTLRNRVYLGQVRNSAGEWIQGKHAAIISPDLFEKAAAALVGRRHTGAKHRIGIVETSDWILREVARCAGCGAKMSAAYAGPQTARRYYYRCSAKCTTRYVPVRSSEEAFGPLVLEQLKALREAIARGNDPKPKSTTRSNYLVDVAALDRRRERILNMYEDGQITRHELNTKLAKLDRERLKVEAEHAAVTRPSPLADAETRRALLGDIRTIERAWASTSPGQRRKIVSALASAVRLAVGFAPTPVWRTAEELAENVILSGDDAVLAEVRQ